MLVVSYNPGYQNLLKGMKPSTRQRFVGLRFDFPGAEQEQFDESHRGAQRGLLPRTEHGQEDADLAAAGAPRERLEP